MIQMAAYYHNARVGVNKTHNDCVVATPETPAMAATTKRVVMDTPSMHNVAAAAKPLADVTVAACNHGDASDEPSQARSLLTLQATSDVHRELYQCQLELQTI